MDDNNNSSKVDNSQSLDDRDAASKARVKLGQAKRDKRNKAKELKAALKQRLRSLDNTKDKRKLKEQFKSALKDIDTGLDSNRSGAGSTVQDDGIDNVDSTENSDDGGGLPDGYVETAVIICVNGSPVSGQFLFKEDAP